MLIFIRHKRYKHQWHVVLWTDKKKIIVATSFDNQYIGTTFITNHMFTNWDLEYL